MDHADVEVVGGVAVAFCNELFGGGEGVGGMHLLLMFSSFRSPLGGQNF